MWIPNRESNTHGKIVQNIIQPTKRVLVEREVCKDVRGCELLKGGNCPDCVMDFVWEWV